MSDQYPTSYLLTDNDVRASFEKCLYSYHVQSNSDYAECLSKVGYEVIGINDVNAFAGKYSDGTPGIGIFQGMLYWCTMMAHVYAAIARGDRIGKIRKMMRWCAERAVSAEGITEDTIVAMEEKYGIVCNGYDNEVIRSRAIAMLTSVFAHEIGHICLHHANYDSNTPTVNRNNERSADLFAASIIESNAPTDMDVVCCVMVDVGFKFFHEIRREKLKRDKKKPDPTAPGTYAHPEPTERIRNFIQAFDAYFRHSAISAKTILAVAGL